MSNKVSNSVDTAPAKEVSNENGVLEALDNATFQWYHLKTVFISGSGFLADAYDLFVISLLTKLIGRIYYPDTTYYPTDYCKALNVTVMNSTSTFLLNNPKCGSNWKKMQKYLDANYLDSNGLPNWALSDALDHAPSALPSTLDLTLKATALVGTFFGQLAFGYLGDKFGRKAMYGLTLIIMITSAICSAMTFGSTPSAAIGTLCTFRFCLGFGVGGDYPLSATIMSEYSSKKTRGMYVAAVFANQGLGYLVAGIVTLICGSLWLGHEGDRDLLWRFVLAIGAIPPATTLYSRLMMPETARYTMMVKGDAAAAARDMGGVLKQEFAAQPTAGIKSIASGQFMKKFGWRLFGCASTWALLDVAFYSQVLS